MWGRKCSPGRDAPFHRWVLRCQCCLLYMLRVLGCPISYVRTCDIVSRMNGLTPTQMPGLNALNLMYPGGEINIIGTPCNDFGKQEPGSNAEIPPCYTNCRPGGGYVPNFHLTEKLSVNGNLEDPLYTYLKAQCPPTHLDISGPKDHLLQPRSYHGHYLEL